MLFKEMGYDSYFDFVKDTFIEDQNSMGLDLVECEDIFDEAPFKQIEKFLIKSGYELGEKE